MKKLTILFAALMLSAGLWAQEMTSWQEAIDQINNAADAAIREIENASTADYVKSIQDQAIQDINDARNLNNGQLATQIMDPFEIDAIKLATIYQINSIKDQALSEIKAKVLFYQTKADAINTIKAVADSAKIEIDSLSTYPAADTAKTKYKEKIDFAVEAATGAINNENATITKVNELQNIAILQIKDFIKEAKNEITAINDIVDAKSEAIAQITSARQGILNTELNALINDAIASINKATTIERITETENNILIIIGMYQTGKADALGSMAEPCTDCTAVEVKKGDKIVTLYAPDQVTYGEAVKKGE